MARRQLTLPEIAHRVVRAEHPELERRDPERYRALVAQALPGIKPLDLLACSAAYESLLVETIASLRNPVRQCIYNTKRLRGDREYLIEQLTEAQQWCQSDTDRGPFSFHRCCLMLSLDPQAVREKLRDQGLFRSAASRIDAALSTKSTKKPAPARDVAVRRAA